MDRITSALLDEFKIELGLTDYNQSDSFELFANYCVVSRDYEDTFDVQDVWTGGGNDTGVDGIATIVNGSLVSSPEEIEDILSLNRYLDVDFIFIQSVTSSAFSATKIGTFLFGVLDFFREAPKLPRNSKIQQAADIKEEIYHRAANFRNRNPRVSAFFVSTGKWTNDDALVARLETGIGDLKATALFDEVDCTPIDADALQRLYRATKNKVSVEITFEHKTVLPEISGVRESYLGILPASEYLKLIVDGNGNIRKSLFYENVRDWQGDNPVNKEISESVTTGPQDQFIVLNNGVTIVAQNVTPTGNRFNIEDYQIVNGCQTSHVLYNNKSGLSDTLWIPVKVVVTQDDDITRRIIKATNRQSPVKDEELRALADFQKKLEEFYRAFDAPHRLYYERRSRQYAETTGIEKVRIVTIGTQIRTFAAMFLDQAHRASRYYRTLLEDVGENIFSENHSPISYYISSYANYKLDSYFRNGYIDSNYRPFRYHILSILRIQRIGIDRSPLNSNEFERQCEAFRELLWDEDQCHEAFRGACRVIDSVATDLMDRDRAKTQGFTTDIREFFSSNP